MFQFPVDPAQLTMGGGIELAWNSLIASARKWSPIVAILAVAQALPTAVMGTGPYLLTDRYSNETTWAPGVESKLPLLFLAYLVFIVVSIVCGWIISAIAISGLRNKPITVEWVVSAGLKSVAGGILLAVATVVAVVAAWIALAIVLVIAGPLSIVLFVFEVALGVYLAVRLAFFTLAIFDGLGPISGIEESWSLSERSVLRMFGWGLMAFVIEIAFSLFTGFITATFETTGLGLLGTIAAAGLAQVGTVFVLFLLTALYESQRARRAYLSQWQSRPPQYGAPYGWGGPVPGQPYPGQYPGYPPAPGYPPQQYPGYPPQPYPPAPGFPPQPGYPPQQYPPQPSYPPEPGTPDQTPSGGENPPSNLWKDDQSTNP